VKTCSLGTPWKGLPMKMSRKENRRMNNGRLRPS
jgi:hypothetical protein